VTEKREVPDEAAWDGYEDDLDVRYLHDLFYGKAIAEVLEHFSDGRSIERMDELLAAPRSIFQYYVFAFTEYVTSHEAEGDSDAAGSLLTLLEAREKRDPGSVSDIYHELAATLDFVATRQEHFDADVKIYGSFRERADRIRQVCTE